MADEKRVWPWHDSGTCPECKLGIAIIPGGGDRLARPPPCPHSHRSEADQQSRPPSRHPGAGTQIQVEPAGWLRGGGVLEDGAQAVAVARVQCDPVLRHPHEKPMTKILA